MVIDDVVLDITVARHALQIIDEILTISFFRNVDDFLLEFVKCIVFWLIDACSAPFPPLLPGDAQTKKTKRRNP